MGLVWWGEGRMSQEPNVLEAQIFGGRGGRQDTEAIGDAWDRSA